MAIEIRCPGCLKRLRVADDWAGRMAQCPGCHMTFEIPGISATAVEHQAPVVASVHPQTTSRGATPGPGALQRRPIKSSSKLADYLLFRRMITPIAIQVIFWIFVAGFLVEGFQVVASQFSSDRKRERALERAWGEPSESRPSRRHEQPSTARPRRTERRMVVDTRRLVALGRAFLLYCVVLPLALRIACEGVIVVFQIHKSVCQIERNTAT